MLSAPLSQLPFFLPFTASFATAPPFHNLPSSTSSDFHDSSLMSDPCPDNANTVHVSPPVRRASSFDTTPVMESPSYRIQCWIGEQDPYPATMCRKPRDSEEARARREHDHVAEVDWELEEFEREMALRFVMRDLQLDLEERRGRTSTSSRSHGDGQCDMSTITRADSDQRKRSLNPWLRSQSSTATLQPLTRLAGNPPSSPPSHSLSLSPAQSSFPPTPRTSHSYVAPPTTPATPERSPHSTGPDSLLRLLRPPTSHKPPPSVLSLSSHFSSCTSSASVSADTDAEVDTGPSASARSLVSQFGQKIKHGFLPHSPVSPYSPRRQKTAPTFMELTPLGVTKKRRVSVPVALVPKKRRLIVRGIKIDDDYGVEGVRRWANGLGEVSRMCRAQDGTIWIEFQDKHVAENVCCLQAQVLIPRVGRVVLDWAEGRQPG